MNELLYTIPAVLIAIVTHEWAHGFISYVLGDPNPKHDGRLSFNPLKHLDPVGTLCLLFFHFGWAKPVQVNPNYYKNKKLGMVLTALAGPIMNFIIAFLSLIVVLVIINAFTMGQYNAIAEYLLNVFKYTAIISIGLGVFNLIPIPPLDGSKILFSILPEKTYFAYMQYERYGIFLLFLLLALGFSSNVLVTINQTLYNGMLNFLLPFFI